MICPSVQRWEEIYDARLLQMNRDYQVEDWTARSADYSESRKTNNYQYGRNVHAVLENNGIISPRARMIEVGSGPGTFVIPFAKQISHVTAVEPAEGMQNQIKTNANEAGIANYDIISSIWQDVDVDSLNNAYDLVISSTVIWMFRDIVEQIRRMEKVSSGYCCLCAGIQSGAHTEDDLWHSIVGERERPQFPEYPLIYDILYENNIHPEVRIITSESRRSPENMFTMYSVFYNLFTNMTEGKEELIRQHVMKHLVDGTYPMHFTSAVLWWKPSLARESVGE
jgi:ubiquinone/menaquinone biosynthesis C-methylase UbiE